MSLNVFPPCLREPLSTRDVVKCHTSPRHARLASVLISGRTRSLLPSWMHLDKLAGKYQLVITIYRYFTEELVTTLDPGAFWDCGI